MLSNKQKARHLVGLTKLGCNVPLPIAGEVHRLAALHRPRRHAAYLIAIRDAAVIFTP
jgi:hypothetical protein